VDLGGSYTHTLFGKPTTFRINATNVGNVRYWASTGGLVLGENLPPTVKFSLSRRFF
jgi:iron complex outermembrane receptor protein